MRKSISLHWLIAAVLLAALPLVVYALHEDRNTVTGLIAFGCAVLGMLLAALITIFTMQALHSAGKQIESISPADPLPIHLPDSVFTPSELRALIHNFNNLLQHAARTRMAEFEAITGVADAIFIAHPGGRITYVNAAGAKLFGDVTGKQLQDIVGEGNAEKILSPNGVQEWKGDVSVRKADGGKIDVFVSSTPILESGRPTSVAIIIQDITSEKAAREARIHSEKMITLGELVAGASHELNNPLAIVTGFSDLLLDERKLTPEQRSKIEAIKKNALRASSVVHGLLAFARKRKPERVRTEINAAVETALALKEYDLRTSGIRIDKRLSAGPLYVSADAGQIQQVFINVLNNAQEAVLAAPGSPEILVRTDSTNSTVSVHIEDSGPGINKDDLKRVFDPFFTTKPLGKGTGLGLSISYGIVQEHGGDITIDNLPERGVRVTIKLPADESRALPSKEKESRARAGDRRFLVVDDEPEIASILQSALSRDGSLVDATSNMTDAYNLALKHRYDFVVTDMKMPGGSGIDLYRKLCTIDSSYQRRVVFLTGDASPSTIEFFEREGLAYFSKPFDVRLMPDLVNLESKEESRSERD